MKYFVINNKIPKIEICFNYNVTLIRKTYKKSNNNLKYVRGLP